VNLTISRNLKLFGTVAIGGLTLLTGMAVVSLNELKIGGPLYQHIEGGKDFTSDILPPPVYVIEAFLETNLAVAEPADVARHKARLAQLHKDYAEHLKAWQASNLPADLKADLATQSDPPAQAFWRETETTLIPALERGDSATARQSLASVSRDYQTHRAAIDRLVGAANAYNDRQEAVAASRAKLIWSLMWGITGVVLALIVGGVMAITRRVTTPLTAITAYMGQLADGDYDREVPYSGRSDEIGSMARSIQVFRQAAVERRRAREDAEAERLRVEARDREAAAAAQAANTERIQVMQALAHGLETLSDGNLTFRIETAFSADYEALRADFNAAMAKLEKTMSVVGANAAAIASGGDELAQASDDLSRRTEQQAASLEETAAALDQITATVRKTAASAQGANGAVAAAKQDAVSSGEVVSGAVQAMGEIEQSSQQITQIIGVIDEIAFQTNLLALNAGVEAARAGDAGRGFAVVASEVRALAQRSAEAAKEIKTLISASSNQVSQGVKLVGQTGAALSAIVAKVAEIDVLVAEIAASAQEQATGLSQVNVAINQMDQVVQQNAAMVEQSAAATHALKGEARELTGLMGQFRTGATEAAARTTSKSRPRPAPVRLVAGGGGVDGWEEF